MDFQNWDVKKKFKIEFRKYWPTNSVRVKNGKKTRDSRSTDASADDVGGRSLNKPVKMYLEPSSRKWFVSNRFHHRDCRACKPLVSQYQILSVKRAWIYSSLSLPRVSVDPKHANIQQDLYVHCGQSFRGSKMPFHLVSQSDSSVINSELWNRLHWGIILGLDAWIQLHASHHKKRP